MAWAIRRYALAAGAAALLSTQAAYAAPVQTRSTGVDPLVSLSVLGTTQSRASILASSAVLQPTTATKTCSDGRVIPASDSCGGTFNPLFMLLGIVLIGGLMVALISGGSKGRGDLTPISPA